MLSNPNPEQADYGIQLFTNPTFGTIRTAGTPDNPQFCLIDLCNALELNPSKVVQRLSDDVLSKYPIPDGLNRIQQTNFVNEDGMYDVILDSRKPEAKALRKWLTSDVLPTLRKTGVYATDDFIEQTLLNPDYGIRLLTSLKEAREEKRLLEAKIEEQKPKVEFADALAASPDEILIGQLATILCKNGIKTGEIRLFDWMRRNGYLGSYGESYNMPTQRSMEMGILTVEERPIPTPKGIRMKFTPKVTAKGQQYFLNKFLKMNAKNQVVDCTNIKLGEDSYGKAC